MFTQFQESGIRSSKLWNWRKQTSVEAWSTLQTESKYVHIFVSAFQLFKLSWNIWVEHIFCFFCVSCFEIIAVKVDLLLKRLKKFLSIKLGYKKYFVAWKVPLLITYSSIRSSCFRVNDNTIRRAIEFLTYFGPPGFPSTDCTHAVHLCFPLNWSVTDCYSHVLQVGLL